MRTIELSIDITKMLIMALVLFIFGLGYDFFVTVLERRPRSHNGFTSLLVVLGTLVTLLATLPLVGLQNFLIVLVAFAASGIPMIFGSISRYMRERDAVAEDSVRDAKERIK